MISSNTIKSLQNIVLKTNSFPVLRKIYFLIYVFAVRYATAILSQVKGIESMYLGEEISESTYIFGSSDIDLVIIMDKDGLSEQKILQKLIGIKRFFPMFSSPGRIFTERQFKNFYNLDPVRMIRRKYKLLMGKDILKECAIFKDRDFIIRGFFGQYFFEFFDLGRKLFLKDLRLHYQRMSLNIFAKMIQYGCYAIGLLEFDKPYRKQEVLRIAIANTGAEFIPYEVRQYMEKNQYRNFPDAGEGERYTKIYSNAIFYLDQISNEWHRKNKPMEADVSSFRITTEFFAQETQKHALLETKGFLDALPGEFLEYFTSIILTSIPNTNYSNRIHMILKGKVTQKDLSAFINWLYQNFKAHFRTKKDYLKPAFPFIMTKNSFRSSPCDGSNIFIKFPLEYFFLARHAKVVYGQDFKSLIERPRDDILYKNMLAYASTLLTYFLGSTQHHFRNFSTRALIDFVDLVCGIFPSIKLFLEKKLIVTTPKETLKEYIRNYKDAGPLNEFYSRYNGLCVDELTREKEDIIEKGYYLIEEQAKGIEGILDATAINYL